MYYGAVFRLKSTGAQLIIEREVPNYCGSPHVENFVFADGTTWDYAQLVAAASQATNTSSPMAAAASFSAPALAGAAAPVGTTGDGTGTENNTIDDHKAADNPDSGTGSHALDGSEVLTESTTNSGIYVYHSGDGNHTISEAPSSADHVDVLRLEDLNPEDITVSRSDTNAVVRDNATGETITLVGQFAVDSPGAGVEQIKFANDTTWTQDDLLREASTIRGTSGNDIVHLNHTGSNTSVNFVDTGSHLTLDGGTNSAVIHATANGGHSSLGDILALEGNYADTTLLPKLSAQVSVTGFETLLVDFTNGTSGNIDIDVLLNGAKSLCSGSSPNLVIMRDSADTITDTNHLLSGAHSTVTIDGITTSGSAANVTTVSSAANTAPTDGIVANAAPTDSTAANAAKDVSSTAAPDSTAANTASDAHPAVAATDNPASNAAPAAAVASTATSAPPMFDEYQFTYNGSNFHVYLETLQTLPVV